MKIFLTRPQVSTRPIVRFPLGLGYICSVLDEAGHEVEVFDQDAVRLTDAELEDVIKASSYDIFAISGLSGQFNDMKKMMEFSKKHHPGSKVIVGGVGFSSMPGFMMDKTMCDIGVMREGEQTIIDLIDSIERERPLDTVKGIWYKDETGIIKNPERERIKDLDGIPFPKWEYFDMEKYIRQGYQASDYRSRGMCMITSRGCPFQCTFCFRDFGRQTMRRSVDNIISEIKELVNRYDINYISFLDELFNSTDEHVNNFCDRLLDEKLKIKWDCRGRVNMTDEKVFKKMKQAGCRYMGFGIESANETILNNMRKNITMGGAVKAIDYTRKHGIKVSCSFMIGMTGETKGSLDETIDFINENNLHKNYGFFYTTPFPGTELYAAALEKGIIKNEDEYIKHLGETHIKPYVNLSNMSDEELGSLKEYADHKIRDDYKKKHKFWFIEETADYFISNGFIKTVGRIIHKVFHDK